MMNTTKFYIENMIIGLLTFFTLVVCADLIVNVFGLPYPSPFLNAEHIKCALEIIHQYSATSMIVMFVFLYSFGTLSSRTIKVVLRHAIEDKNLRYKYYENIAPYIPDIIMANLDKKTHYDYVRSYVKHYSASSMTALDYDRSIIRISRGLFVNFILLIIFGSMHLFIFSNASALEVSMIIIIGAIFAWGSYKKWTGITNEYHKTIMMTFLVIRTEEVPKLNVNLTINDFL